MIWQKEHFLRGKLQMDKHLIVTNFKSWTLQETLALLPNVYDTDTKPSEPLKDHCTNNLGLCLTEDEKLLD